MLVENMSYRNQLSGFAVCAIITAAVTFHSYMRPYNNWDEIAYVGSAISWSVKSPVETQNLTYQFVRQATSKESFREDTGDPYRSAVYHNSNTFALQLPFYKIKPVYVGLIWLGWKLGFNPARASSAISAIAAGCLGLIVAGILAYQIAGIGSIIIYPIVILFGGISPLGRFSTPDALSALLVFGGLWLLRRSCARTSEAGFLLLCVAVGTRPDNVVLVLACAAVLVLAGMQDGSVELPPSRIAQFAVLGVVLWLILGRLAGYYGWKVLIEHSFVRMVTTRNDLTTFKWVDYGHALMSGVAWLIGSSPQFGIPLTGFSPQFPLVFLLTCLLAYFQEQRRDSLLLIAVLFYMLVHFVLFPSGQERFFYGVETFILVLGAHTIIGAVSKAAAAKTQAKLSLLTLPRGD